MGICRRTTPSDGFVRDGVLRVKSVGAGAGGPISIPMGAFGGVSRDLPHPPPLPSQLEQTLRLETGEREAVESRSLAQHNIELRRLLEEEQAAYKRKLQAYQEGQQRQAQLVQKLQAKVNPSWGTQGHFWGEPPQCHPPRPLRPGVAV